MTKQISSAAIALFMFILFFLSACGAQTAATPTPLPPRTTPKPSSTVPILRASGTAPEFLSQIAPSATASLTPTATSNATATTDYAALGLPSPTPTSTLSDEQLAERYLTPFTPWPTETGHPSATPTTSIATILSRIIVRKVTPQAPMTNEMEKKLQHLSYDQLITSWMQSATDLMNYANDDEQIYLQYINSWAPKALGYSSNDWFLKNDFDNDGQSEWLVSVPIRNAPKYTFLCDQYFRACQRAFFLFKKIAGEYRPISTLLTLDPYQYPYGEDKIRLIKDLNNNHLPDIVFEADVCGSACSTRLQITEWDGHNWKKYTISASGSKVTFADLDSNGTTEITLKYSDGGRWFYPFRQNLVDVYGWKNERYEMIDQVRPPTDNFGENMRGTIYDINDALMYKNVRLALGYAKPITATLAESCDQMKAFVGIQTMMAYGIQDDQTSMQATLAEIQKYCDASTNGYVQMAKILWLAYQQSHNIETACQAIDRFLNNEYRRKGPKGPWEKVMFLGQPSVGPPDCPFREKRQD